MKTRGLTPLLLVCFLLLAILVVILSISQPQDIRNRAAGISTNQKKCTPRPSCLDKQPPCRLPEPSGGWCKQTPTPTKSSCRPRPDCLDYDPPCQAMPPKEGFCPSASLSCQTCLNENKRSLCLDKNQKIIYCSNQSDIARDPNRVCVSCGQSYANPTTPIKSSIPALAVGNMMGSDWFQTWAKDTDIIVSFGESPDFQKIIKPLRGKVGWNSPDLSNIIATQSLWQNKIDVIIYDYEKWDKTPLEEQNDPEGTAKKAQFFADRIGKELIFGSSWRMAVQGLSTDQIRSSQGKIDWDSYLDKDRIGKIVANVKNYGVNATGLRAELPDAYTDFFNAISSYAISVNPNINLWPVLDARNQTAREMYQMYQNFKGNTKGLIIMGTNSETNVVEEFLQLTRK